MAKKGGGFLYRQAQVRGLLGGSRPWRYVWILLMARRVLRRVTTDKPEVVYRQELRPGEAIIVSARETEPRIIGQ